MKTTLSLLIAMAFFTGLEAFAGNKPYVPADNPCKNDIQKYCSNKNYGNGLVPCMKAHASELSAGCKSFGEQLKKQYPGIAGGKHGQGQNQSGKS